MEILISNLRKVTDNKYIVGSINYCPNENLNEGKYLVTQPQQEYRPNTNEILCYNPNTNECWYEYEIITTPVEEKVKKLEEENANINYALMMGGLI